VTVARVAVDALAVYVNKENPIECFARTVALAVAEGTACCDTSAEAAYSQKYPFARYLHIYINKTGVACG
jgi:ABC-type phosphate transport system substrate-binding protein